MRKDLEKRIRRVGRRLKKLAMLQKLAINLKDDGNWSLMNLKDSPENIVNRLIPKKKQPSGLGGNLGKEIAALRAKLQSTTDVEEAKRLGQRMLVLLQALATTGTQHPGPPPVPPHLKKR